MIKNYIKTAYRSLIKNKSFTAINVLGLALGLATCMLIVFYVSDELGYDTYNTKADRIYRVNNDIKFAGNINSYAVSPAPLAAAMVNEFPEVEKSARLREKGELQVKKDGQNVQEHHVIYADATLFSIFTLPMLTGNPATALIAPHTVVITESTAKKYFNTIDAVNKTLTFNDTALYKVTGVIKDIPRQSHFNYDFFMSMSSLQESKEEMWLGSNFVTYILLKPGVSYKSIEDKFPAFVKNHVGAQLQSIVHLSYDAFEKGGSYFKMNLIPLRQIHLYSNRVAELSANGSIQYVYIFSAIAIFILLIACVNFMNLATARSANRAREVGVRKVLGSPRKYLIAQFLSESVMITFGAAVIAVCATWVLLPFFNQLSGKQLIVSSQVLARLIPALILIVVVIGCMAGAYPAFYLSAFQPIDVLKGKIATGFKAGWLRSFLVVFQFSISIFLIIGTLVIYNQLKYIQNKDLGYKRGQVIIIPNVHILGNQAKTFKQEIKQISGVQNVTMSGFLPNEGSGNSNTVFQNPEMDVKKAMLTQVWPIDEDYINTLGMKLASGRNFSAQMLTDSAAVMINEAAARRLGVLDPLNKALYLPADNQVKRLKNMRIIGVVKDFNFLSLRDNITPMVFILEEDRGAIAVKIATGNIPAVIAQIKSKWKNLAANQQFNYSFMDADFDADYRAEQRMGQLFITFTILAIIIACLGLFGLAAYAAEQRTKEIGIRKVLGASVSVIVKMLSKDFIKLVLIAIIISTPIAWYLMQKWLQDFAYRVNIHWWILTVAGAVAILIAFVTISFQSIKAAIANPVDSLRSE